MNFERDDRRWRRVVQVLLSEAEHVRSERARAEKFLEIARIYHTQLNDPQAAANYFRDAAALDTAIARQTIDLLTEFIQAGESAATERVLLEILSDAEHGAELVHVLRQLAGQTGSATKAVEYYLQASNAAIRDGTDQVGARSALIGAHRRAAGTQLSYILEQTGEHLTLWPADEAVAALRAMLLVEEGRGREAVDALLGAAAHTTSPRIKAKLRLRAASLSLDVVGQPMEAINALRDALAIDPGVADQAREILNGIPETWRITPTLLAELVDAFDTIGDVARAQQMYAMCIGTAEVTEIPDLYMRQAQHADLHNLEPADRFGLYYEGAQACMGDLEPYVAGMRKAAWDGATDGFETLANLLEAEEAWGELVDVLDDYAMIAADDSRRAQITYRSGQVTENEIGDGPSALTRYLQALDLDQKEDIYAQAAERIYRATENWERVDGILELRFGIALNRSDKMGIRLQQGVLRQQQLGEPVAAYDTLRDALKLAGDENTDQVYTAMSELICDVWAFPAIEDRIKARIEAAETKEKSARIAIELSILYLEFLHDTDGGLATLREAADRCEQDAAVFLRVTQQFERHADELTLARWLEGARERPLNIGVKKNALEQALAIYQNEGADWTIVRRIWDAILELDASEPNQVQTAVDAAEAVDDTGAVSHFLSLALDGSGQQNVSEMLRLRWMRRLAEIHNAQGDLGEAVRRHRAILQQWPLDADAYAGLHRCYTELEDWGSLNELLRTHIGLLETGSNEPQHQLRIEWSLLLSRHLFDTEGAILALVPLVDRRELDEESAELLMGLYEERGDSLGQIRVLESQLSAIPSQNDYGTIRRMVEIVEAVGLRGEVAERALRHEIALDPSALEPRYRLLAIFRESADRARLLKELEEVWHLKPVRSQLAVLRERSQLLSDSSADIGLAIDSWEELLRHENDDIQGLKALQYLYTQAERDEDVRRIIQQRLKLDLDLSSRLTLLREEAILAELKIGDMDGAFSAWAKAHELDPNSGPILEELIRLSEDRQDRDALVKYGRLWFELPVSEDDTMMLRRIAIACSEEGHDSSAIACWTRLLEVDSQDGDALEILAKNADNLGEIQEALVLYGRLADCSKSMGQQQMALRRMAILHQDRDEGSRAIEIFKKLSVLDPTSTEPWLEIYRLSVDLALYDEASQAITSAIERSRSADERANLNREAAIMAGRDLNDSMAAVYHWEQLLLIEPLDVDALNAIWPLYCQQGRRLEMLRTLDSLARAATNAQLAGQYLADAAIWVESGKFDEGIAFECWWRAHKLSDGGREEALEHLKPLAERTDRWQDYVDALELAASHALEFQERANLYSEAAHLASTRLDDFSIAFEYLRRAVIDCPDRDDLVDRLVDATRQVDTKPVWLSLSETLRFVAENCTVARPDLFVEAGLALAKCRQGDQAYELMAHAINQSSGYVGCETIFSFAGEHGYLDQLAETLKSAVSELPEGERSGRLAVFGAHFEQLHDCRERALEHYLQALQLDFENTEIRDHVWRLARLLKAWPLVVNFYDLLTDLAHDPADRFRYLCQRAHVERDELGDLDGAFATLKRAISLRPTDAEARRTLDVWAEESGRQREMAAFYEEEGAWAEQDGARIDLYRGAVELYRQCADAESAARLVKLISELAPDDEQLVDERIELLEQSGDLAELSSVLQRQSERARGARRLSFLKRLARLHTNRLGDRAVAEKAWLGVLEIDPEDGEAFLAATTLFRNAQEWAQLDQVLAQRRERITGAERISLLHERAELAQGALELPAQAFTLIGEIASASDTDVDILFRMESLIESRGQASELLRLAEHRAETVDDDEKLRILRLSGRLSLTHLERPQSALNALNSALELCTDDLALARQVAALQRRQRKHEDLLTTYRHYGTDIIVPSDANEHDVNIQWHLDVGEMLEQNLLDFGGAAETYEHLLLLDPTHREALEKLRRLLIRLRDVPRLAEVILTLAEMTSSPHDVLMLVEGARGIQGMGQLPSAIPLWRLVLEKAPGTEEAQETVMRHARRDNDLDMMRSVHRARIRSARNNTEKATRLSALAKFERESAHDDESAMAAYGAALDEYPAWVEALMGLAELSLIHQQSENIETLGQVMIERFDAGLEEAEVERFSNWLALLQVARAQIRLSGEDGSEVLDILRMTYQRAPRVRESAQLYADQLYQSGDLVAAGRVYDRTMLPSFVPGTDGDELRAQEHLRRAHAFAAIESDVQAIHHFETAARHQSTRADAFRALAEIQEKAERWEAAARFREKLADVLDDPSEASESLARAGMILHENLGRFHRALILYRRAIVVGLTEPVMLLRVLDLFETGGHHTDALEVIDRLLTVELTGRTKAKLQIRRSRLLAASGARHEAILAVTQAVELDPGDPERIEILLDMLESQSHDVDESIVELESLAENALNEWSQPHLLRMAHWYAVNERIEKALGISERLTLGGEDNYEVLDGRARLNFEQYKRQEEPHNLERAIENRQASLQALPGEPDALRHLAQILDAQGRPEDMLLPLGLLTVMGRGEKSEIERVNELMRDAKPARVSLECAQADASESVKAVNGLLAQLLDAAGGPLDEAFRMARHDEFKSWQPADDTLNGLVQLIQSQMQWPPTECGYIDDWTGQPDSIGFNPNRIAVSHRFAENNAVSEQVFHLSRAMYLGSGTACFVSCIPPEESLAILAATVALVDGALGPEYALATMVGEDAIAYWAGFLCDGTTEEQRAEWLSNVREVIEAGPEGFIDWADWVYASANRVALVISGDLATAIKALKSVSQEARNHVVTSPNTFRELLEMDPSIARLHAFAFGAVYEESRLATGADSLDGRFLSDSITPGQDAVLDPSQADE